MLWQIMMDTYACKQLINSATTDFGSTLDLIFTQLEGVIENYWPDHKLIYFAEKIK